MEQNKLILFMPSIEGGGVEKNLFIVSNYLSKKVRNISLITASKSYRKKFNKKIKLITPNSSLWDKLGRKRKYLICLWLLFKEIIKHKKILVFCFQANIYCLIICKIFKIKIIVRSNSSSSGWSQNIVKNFIFKKMLNKADKTMVNSNDFKKELKKKFNINAVCIYNPLNIKEIKKLSKTNIREKFFKDKKILKIINVGRFTDQKDHITLLKAANVLKNKIKFKILIIGRGVNEFKIKKYIKNNNLEKIVKIKNFNNNPFPYIRLSDLFILSSTFEGLPNVILEALALNKFVISSNCPTGPREILLNNKGGLLFKTKDYNDLANKILFYYNNRNICKKKLAYAKANLNRFNYDKNLNEYLKLVKSFLI